jgi:5-methylcytosine-specific restriction protein A
MKLPWDSKRTSDRKVGGYQRERSANPYHTYRWTQLSVAFRSEPDHCICALCLKEGRYTPAQVVDHIIPWPICGEDGFFDRKNLQALCSRHNIDKGNKDKKAIQEWKRRNQNQ